MLHNSSIIASLIYYLLTCSWVRATHVNPIRCYNAYHNRNCRVIIRVPDLPADNPQQSEEASHMGGNANLKCRKCKKGGSHAVTESNEGYHALYYVSNFKIHKYPFL